MKINNPAIAGTLESSDCLVTVEPGTGSVELDLESVVIHQYGHQIKKVVMETLKRMEVEDVQVHIIDKGALDCTIKARVECAIFRTANQTKNLPWGGAVR